VSRTRLKAWSQGVCGNIIGEVSTNTIPLGRVPDFNPLRYGTIVLTLTWRKRYE
jgi:hypothetical protein